MVYEHEITFFVHLLLDQTLPLDSSTLYFFNRFYVLLS